MTLCTIGLDGSPRGRTMALPKISEHLGEIVVATSTESLKWKELERDPRFEIIMYFSETGEQYRMRGDTVKFHGLEQETWNALPDVYKEWFNHAKDKLGKDTFGVIQFLPNHSVEHIDMRVKMETHKQD